MDRATKARDRELRCRLEAFFAAIELEGQAAATKLADRFSCLSDILGAGQEVLAVYCGEGAAQALAAVQELRSIASGESLFARRSIRTASEASEFIQTVIGNRSDEWLVVLFLDSRQRLIDYEIVAVGRPGAVDFDIRRIILLALGRGASGIILAHNHPSGEATPSPTDRRVTRQVTEAARACGIMMHDHFVVAGREIRSATDC